MNTKLSFCAAAVAVLLGACASTPSAPPELINARAAVRQAETDPNVLNYGQLELKKATDALNKANTLLADRDSLSNVASAAYVAQRHAEAAMAIGRAKGNEDAMKAAQTERERARADAARLDAERAQAQAERARDQAAMARADASSARSQASVAAAQANSAQIQAEAARSQASEAERRAADAQAEKNAAQAAAEQARLQNTVLIAELSEMKAQQTERGMLVTLGDVLFEFNRAEIKPTAQASLRKLADFLQKHPERRLLIEGFTDSIGSPSYNASLSLRRAESVANALVALGVAPDRIVARGYGMEYPIAENTTDTNRALNRRVEVYISESNRPVRQRG